MKRTLNIIAEVLFYQVMQNPFLIPIFKGVRSNDTPKVESSSSGVDKDFDARPTQNIPRDASASGNFSNRSNLTLTSTSCHLCLSQTEPSASSNESMSREDQERRFTDSVRLAEKELFILLQPLVQERTLHRFVKVARILRDPAIVRASFLQEDTSGVLHGVRELVQEVLDTVGEMAEEQKDRELERVSKSKSKPRRSRTRTKSKKQTSRSKKATSAK